jgi:hypothetical protein
LSKNAEGIILVELVLTDWLILLQSKLSISDDCGTL